MLSRDLVPIHKQCASVASIDKPLPMARNYVETLPIVDVDKSAALFGENK
jgi:hypothetical protein